MEDTVKVYRGKPVDAEGFYPLRVAAMPDWDGNVPLITAFVAGYPVMVIEWKHHHADNRMQPDANLVDPVTLMHAETILNFYVQIGELHESTPECFFEKYEEVDTWYEAFETVQLQCAVGEGHGVTRFTDQVLELVYGTSEPEDPEALK